MFTSGPTPSVAPAAGCMLPAMAIDVAALSTDELYELGKKLGVKGRSKMNADELRAACQTALTERGDPAEVSELETELEPETETVPGPRGPDAPPVNDPDVTVEQIQKIKAARIESLEAVISDMELPPKLRQAVVDELEERQKKVLAAEQAHARYSPMVRYRVTKGGRYVSREGFVTHLSEGTLVTPLTHDLKHVASQGILWDQVSDVGVEYGQLGEQISKVQ